MNKNLTLSMGAMMVLATTPATPPEMKLLMDFDLPFCYKLDPAILYYNHN